MIKVLAYITHVDTRVPGTITRARVRYLAGILVERWHVEDSLIDDESIN